MGNDAESGNPVEIEDARMASGVTEMLMGTEVPPRRAFIYENATEAELDI